MTNEQAYADERAEEMNELSALLHKAMLIARRLKGRGVDMDGLGISPSAIEYLRDRAEDAYTLGKV